MTNETVELAKYRLERAFEALDEAALLFQSGHTNTYVNRLYYSCFYAISALLIIKEQSTSKHSYLRAIFHKDFIKTGIFSKDIGKHFDLLFQSRQQGDYADNIRFNPDDVRDWFDRTKKLVEEINQYLMPH